MDILSMLQGQLSPDMVGQLSDHVGASPEQTTQAANGIFATLLGGLANNATSEGGLSALSAALDRDHDVSIIDDVLGMVGGLMQGGDGLSKAANGSGILGHVLGDRQEAAAEQIGQSSGLNMGQVMKLMPILAPLVMSALGKAKSSGGLDLGGLAGVLMGSAQQAQQQTGMGDLIGSILGQVMGGNQNQAQPSAGDMLGNLLGGMLGK